MMNRTQIKAILFIAMGIGFAGSMDLILGAEDPVLSRPIGIALSSAEPLAYIANQGNACITEVNIETGATSQIPGDWNAITDITLAPGNRGLIAISSYPPRIHEVAIPASNKFASRSLGLPGEPNRIAVSNDGKLACVSMTWNHAVCLLEMQEGQLLEESNSKVLTLGFQPKDVLAMENGLFLVADAFGGELAVVDATLSQVIAKHKILGHHIGGLARDVANKTVAVTHQKLSAVAQTNRDDIHWGTLMQNVVTIIPEAVVLDPSANQTKLSERSQLGIVGNGAADPSGVVAHDGQLVVAIAGTNQIAYRDHSRKPFHFISVKVPPTQLVWIGNDRLLWISKLGDTAGVMERVDGQFQLRFTIGQERQQLSPAELGEIAFFSGKHTHDGWMSCNSCHVDGHTPDLLADTQGDERFDNPKRIPSLLNVASTGPWAWNGSQRNLEEQIAKTLSTTMHREIGKDRQSGSNAELAKNIAAYLRTLQLPQSNQGQENATEPGANLFQERGCSRCHNPELQYTSPDTYDVGIVDETGETKFNPPSLLGLRYRRSYLHDARYRRLDELLQNHPDIKKAWTQQELGDIQDFLMSL